MNNSEERISSLEQQEQRASRQIERLARKLLASASAACLIMLLGFVSWIFGIISDFLIPALLCGCAIAVGSFFVVKIYAYRFKRINIRLALIRELSKTDERPPLLLLRSFAKTDLTDTCAHFFLGNRRSQMIEGGVAFSYFFGQAAAPTGRLIAIGKVKEVGGHFAGRLGYFGVMDEVEQLYIITDEERWYRVFLYLAEASRAIILIPEITAGVEREMSILAHSNLTSKTLVFMPPTPKNVKGIEEFVRQKYANRWRTVREYWQARGLNLPDYDLRGMVYRPNADFSIQHCRVIGNGSGDDAEYSLIADYSRIKEAITGLLGEITESGARPLSVVLDYLESERLILN